MSSEAITLDQFSKEMETVNDTFAKGIIDLTIEYEKSKTELIEQAEAAGISDRLIIAISKITEQRIAKSIIDAGLAK